MSYYGCMLMMVMVYILHVKAGVDISRMRMVDCGRLTADCGPRTVDRGRWAARVKRREFDKMEMRTWLF